MEFSPGTGRQEGHGELLHLVATNQQLPEYSVHTVTTGAVSLIEE